MIFIYIIFLLSGIIKTILIFYGISLPVDLTLISAILLITAIIYDFYIHGVKLSFGSFNSIPLLLLLLFFVWILFSTLYSKSDDYSYRKSFLFLTNIIAFIFPIIIKEFQLLKFLKLFTISVIACFIWFYYVYFILTAEFFETELYYQVIGLYLSLAVLDGLVLLILLTSGFKIFKKNLYNLLTIILLIVFLILSGARGPIFFVIITLGIYYSLKLFKNKISKKVNLNNVFRTIFFGLTGLTLLVFIGVYKFYNEISVLLERSLYRISLIFNGISDNSGMGDSVDVRINQFEFSFESIFNNLQSFFVGYGFGSFGIMYTGEDGRLYPHNILLEIWFELGLIGLILFLFFLTSVFWGRLKTKIYISGFVLLYILLNMLKSSSIIDIRIYFALFALFIIDENFFKNIKKGKVNGF